MERTRTSGTPTTDASVDNWKNRVTGTAHVEGASPHFFGAINEETGETVGCIDTRTHEQRVEDKLDRIIALLERIATPIATSDIAAKVIELINANTRSVR